MCLALSTVTIVTFQEVAMIPGSQMGSSKLRRLSRREVMEARASWSSSCSAWLTQAFPCCWCAVKCPSARRRPDVSGPSVMSAGPSLTEKSMWGVRQPHTPHWGTSEHRELQSFLSFEGSLAPKFQAPHSLPSLLPENSATSQRPSPAHAPTAATAHHGLSH